MKKLIVFILCCVTIIVNAQKPFDFKKVMAAKADMLNDDYDLLEKYMANPKIKKVRFEATESHLTRFFIKLHSDTLVTLERGWDNDKWSLKIGLQEEGYGGMYKEMFPLDSLGVPTAKFGIDSTCEEGMTVTWLIDEAGEIANEETNCRNIRFRKSEEGKRILHYVQSYLQLFSNF